MVEFSVTTRVAGFVCSCHSRRVCGGFRLGGPLGGSPWWANTVHHVITSPSHRTSVLVWMLIEWQIPTLLLYTASCTRRMRVTAFFTSRVIALDFFAVGGGWPRPPVKLILTCSRPSWCCACGSSSRAEARAGHHTR